MKFLPLDVKQPTINESNIFCSKTICKITILGQAGSCRLDYANKLTPHITCLHSQTTSQ